MGNLFNHSQHIESQHLLVQKQAEENISNEQLHSGFYGLGEWVGLVGFGGCVVKCYIEGIVLVHNVELRPGRYHLPRVRSECILIWVKYAKTLRVCIWVRWLMILLRIDISSRGEPLFCYFITVQSVTYLELAFCQTQRAKYHTLKIEKKYK